MMATSEEAIWFVCVYTKKLLQNYF